MTTGSIVTSGDTYLRSKTWTGADDPVFHRQRNPYTCVIVHEDYNVFTAYTDGYCYPWTASGRFQPTPYYRMPSVSPDFKALERLVQKIRGHQFDLGNYIPEGRETVAMTRNVLGRVASGLQAIRRKDIDGLVRSIGSTKVPPKTLRKRLTTKNVAQQHLELQYGIIPLLSDVYESATAFAAIANRPRKMSVTASASTKDLWVEQSYVSGYEHSITGRSSVRYKAEFVEMNPLRSLGLLDPAGMIWEGIPFSFVIDWFIPIGQYLDLLNVIPYLDGQVVTTRYSVSTHRLSKVRTASCNSGGWSPSLGPAPYSNGRRIEVIRSIGTLDGLTIPPPEFKPLSKAMSPLHVWNAIALARSML